MLVGLQSTGLGNQNWVNSPELGAHYSMVASRGEGKMVPGRLDLLPQLEVIWDLVSP